MDFVAAGQSEANFKPRYPALNSGYEDSRPLVDRQHKVLLSFSELREISHHAVCSPPAADSAEAKALPQAQSKPGHQPRAGVKTRTTSPLLSSPTLHPLPPLPSSPARHTETRTGSRLGGNGNVKSSALALVASAPGEQSIETQERW